MTRPLSPTKKNPDRKDYQFQVVDLEANHWINFLCGGFYDGDEYFEFRDINEIVNYFYESETKINCFAHFGGGYDFLFIIQAILDNEVKIKEITMRGSLMLAITFQGKYHVHTLRDSSALLPFSLDSLTKNFDVETKKGTYDHSLNRGYNKELSDYLRSDCIGLYQTLQKFFGSELVRSAGYATTIASQAHKILTTYIKEPIFSPPEHINEFMRKACHGGRTEIFKPLGENIREYDVNSLYPFVMKNNFFMKGRLIKTNTFRESNLGIYEVIVTVPDDIHIPCIPMKDEGKLLFPKGTFKTTCTSAEIIYARSLGYEFKIITGYYSSHKEKYFETFIDDLYKIRQLAASGSVDNIIAKLIMNSSYGKFIIKKDRTNLVIDKQLGGRFYRDVKIGNKIIELYENDIEINTFSHCGIGAFILAYARIHMHKLMNLMPESVYYTDTDSIWTDKILKSSGELGALKLEKPSKDKEEWDRVCFLLPKTYIAEINDYKKIAMKGFDKRKIKHFTFKDFESALFGEFNLKIDNDETIAKLRTSLKSKKFLSLKAKYEKQIRSTYNKRILNLKENTSEAIKLKI